MARIKVEDWLTEGSLLQIEEWARAGYTDKEIYQAIHISKSTFRNWRNKYPVIDEHITKGRQPVITDVEQSFIASCTDRYVNEVTIKKLPDGSKIEQIKKKFVPAKTGAAIFFLKTHLPDKYGPPEDRVKYKRMELENQKLIKELELKELQIAALQRAQEQDTDELAKVDLILQEFENEALEDAEDVLE